MDFIKQGAVLFGVCVAGMVTSILIGGFIPANIMGMLIMLALLFSKVLKSDDLADFQKIILQNLPFFFIPQGVKFIQYFDVLGADLWKFILIVVLSTLLVAVLTGHTVQTFRFISNKIRNKGKEERDND